MPKVATRYTRIVARVLALAYSMIQVTKLSRTPSSMPETIFHCSTYNTSVQTGPLQCQVHRMVRCSHSGTTLVPSLRTSPALSVVSVGGLDVAIWHSTVFHSICREGRKLCQSKSTHIAHAATTGCTSRA